MTYRFHHRPFRCLWPVAVGLALAGASGAVGQPPSDYTRYLQLFELSEAEDRVQDDAPLTPAERAVIERCAECVARIPATQLAAWRTEMDDPFADDPGRFKLFAVRGRLRQLDTTERTGQLRYEVQVQLTSTQSATVYLQRVPRSWQQLVDTEHNWDERVAISAIYFKRDEDQAPLFIGNGLEWYPDRAQPTPWVAEDHVLLAQYGLDIGELQDVQPVGPLSAEDAAPFYATLAVTTRVPAPDWNAAATPTNVVDLLQDLPSHRGKFYRLQGTARRILKIVIDDPTDRKRAGLDHYYELELFVEPRALVRVRGTKDNDSRVFATYPIVYCCTALPPDCPQGEDVHVPLEVSGVYFKSWQYATPFMQGLQLERGEARQTSPLLIGPSPRQLAPPAKIGNLGLPLAVIFAIALVAVTLYIVRSGAQDRAVSRQRRARSERPPQNPSQREAQ